MYSDTHCHIFSIDYDNIDYILKNLEKNNIRRIIINGYNYESNKELISLIKKYKNVYGSLGIHPNNIEDFNEKTINLIKENLNHEKILAVGEIGLDYYWNNKNKEEQINLFKTMLDLACNYNKPVIIHNRQSTDDIIRILKKYNRRGIIHSFSGSYETALEFIKLNFIILI